MKTLLLDQDLWDWVKDASGNIAIASDPYSKAQDVASEARVFLGECTYYATRGLPYVQQDLGQLPPLAAFKAQYVTAAYLVPGVLKAACYLTGLNDRGLSGQLQFTDESGVTQNVGVGQ